MSEQKGYIYILTNPSFPDYVKIGYADDVERRLKQLNRSECTPFAFRVFATYQVNSRLSDKKIHEIIDKLNPDLRSIETVENKKRVREFYAMTPEDAYDLFKAIAEMHGYEKRLTLITPDKKEKEDEIVAEEIQASSTKKGKNFSFEKCKIPVGSELVYTNDKKIKCFVVDDRRVEYNGQVMYLTGLAKMLLNKTVGICGPLFFEYNGKNLQEYYVMYQRGIQI